MHWFGKHLSAAVAALIMAILLAFSGCTSAQKKPLPPRPGTVIPPDRVPRTDVKPTPQKTPANTTISTEFNGKAQAETGVKKAYTVVMGNVAIAGIEINTAGNIKTSQDIRKRVTKRLEGDHRIVRAYVTTDPAITAEVKKMAGEIYKGKPATDYMDQLQGIIRRIQAISF